MKSIYFGGPWYRSVHPKLVISSMRFACESPIYGYQVNQMSYADGMLDIGRNLLLQRAIDSGCHWFVSVDADVSFYAQAKAICRALDEADRQATALVAAPLELPDGAANVVNVHDDMLPSSWIESSRSQPTPVNSIGFGFVAFRLGWYVSNWPKEKTYFQSQVARIGNSFIHAGEDYNHCKAVRELGGLVICDPRIGAVHELGRTVK